MLAELSRSVPGALVLWRGPELDGGDVDLVVRPGRDREVLEALGGLGLAPWPARPGETTWRLPAETVVLDVWASWAWPASYPPLPGLLDRAGVALEGLELAAAEDRLLIFAVDAVLGRRLVSLRPKVARALAEPGAAERLRALADAEHMRGLAALVATKLPEGNVLPPRRAMRAAVGSRRGRLALVERVRGAQPARPPGAPGGARGRLVALSGLDGSGKSSAGLALAAEFERQGQPAIVVWTRIGADLRALHRLANLVRPVLGRERGASSAIDPSSAVAARTARLSESAPRASLVGSVWPILVALSHVRGCRRLLRARRSGTHVVCDRWLADALIDLHLRYGRQPLAEWVLRVALPRPDLALLLEVTPAVAALRKPGDQDAETLARMRELYDERATALGLTRIDADRPAAAVCAAVVRLVRG